MKACIALKINYDEISHYTNEHIEKIVNQWKQAYQKIMSENANKEEICIKLIQRIEKAAQLFNDDKEAEDLKLDGDFPLGNQEDMQFASYSFSIDELAMIQAGLSDKIYAGYYVEHAENVLVRKGILAEMQGNYKEAAAAYAGVSYSMMVLKREQECRKKMKDK